MGALADDLRGVCPLNCQAVSRTTGYQAKVGPDRTLYQAPADGRIVAWTIALGNPGPKQTAFFAERLGGESQAAVVVLAAEKKLVRRVVAKAPLERLTDYFGSDGPVPARADAADQEGPVRRACRCPRGRPRCSSALGNDTSWRASRPKDACPDTSTQFALIGNRRAVPFALPLQDGAADLQRDVHPAPVAVKPTKAKSAVDPKRASPVAAAPDPLRRRAARVQQAPGFSEQKFSNSPPPACAPPVVDWPPVWGAWPPVCGDPVGCGGRGGGGRCGGRSGRCDGAAGAGRRRRGRRRRASSSSDAARRGRPGGDRQVRRGPRDLRRQLIVGATRAQATGEREDGEQREGAS